MDVKISIIMTTYNCIQYIERSVRSFQSQTIKNIELICIDGHSTDGTLSVLRGLQEKDARIKIYDEEGIGIGGAKNTGIRKSVGEFVTFLDADDYYIDNRALELMYSAAKEHDVKICGAFRAMLFPDGYIEENPLHRLDCENHPEGVLLNYRDRQYDYHFHSYIFDREMLMENKAEFAESLCYDDPHFLIRAMLAAGEFYVCPVELYMYLMGPPYHWDDKHTNDALRNFIDELVISSRNQLEQLHYLTVQRMNNEYKENFVRCIRSGNLEVLSLLLEANEMIDPQLIDQAEKEQLPKGYLEAMYYGQIEDRDIIKNDSGYSSQYILSALADVLFLDYNKQKKEIERLNDDITQLKKEVLWKNNEIDMIEKAKMTQMDEIKDLEYQIDHIEESISYKVGRGITFFPRIIRKVIKAARLVHG